MHTIFKLSFKFIVFVFPTKYEPRVGESSGLLLKTNIERFTETKQPSIVKIKGVSKLSTADKPSLHQVIPTTCTLLVHDFPS